MITNNTHVCHTTHNHGKIMAMAVVSLFYLIDWLLWSLIMCRYSYTSIGHIFVYLIDLSPYSVGRYNADMDRYWSSMTIWLISYLIINNAQLWSHIHLDPVVYLIDLPQCRWILVWQCGQLVGQLVGPLWWRLVRTVARKWKHQSELSVKVMFGWNKPQPQK